MCSQVKVVFIEIAGMHRWYSLFTRYSKNVSQSEMNALQFKLMEAFGFNNEQGT